MKKLVLILSILLTTLSCTKDDASQNQDSSVLPKRIIRADSYGSLEFSIIYDGNKIKEITNIEGRKSIYTYTNDLITNVTTYEGKLISGINDYFYENGKIKSAVNTFYSIKSNTSTPDYKSRINYTTNADGTILEETYSIDLITGVETKTADNITYTFTNGNLTKSISLNSNTYFNGSQNVTNVYKKILTYEYDNYKNPINNILGLNKIAYDETLSSNNILKETTTSESTTNGVANTPTTTPTIINYILTYNANNFLTESKYYYKTSNNTNATYSQQYFYE
jgi:hypothetical protein